MEPSTKLIYLFKKTPHKHARKDIFLKNNLYESKNTLRGTTVLCAVVRRAGSAFTPTRELQDWMLLCLMMLKFFFVKIAKEDFL